MEDFDAPTLYHHDESMPPIEPGTFGFGYSRRSFLATTGLAALGALLAACGGDNKSSSPTTASGGATTTAASGGATTTAAAGASTSAATGATTTAGARTEAKTETITVGVPSLQEAFVDPHWAVGGLIFPLMWAIADFLYMQDAERQVRAEPGDRLRPQRRQADLDVQAAPRREDAGRVAVHGQPT